MKTHGNPQGNKPMIQLYDGIISHLKDIQKDVLVFCQFSKPTNVLITYLMDSFHFPCDLRSRFTTWQPYTLTFRKERNVCVCMYVCMFGCLLILLFHTTSSSPLPLLQESVPLINELSSSRIHLCNTHRFILCLYSAVL